jgi:hypothetical protein
MESEHTNLKKLKSLPLSQPVVPLQFYDGTRSKSSDLFHSCDKRTSHCKNNLYQSDKYREDSNQTLIIHIERWLHPQS